MNVSHERLAMARTDQINGQFQTPHHRFARLLQVFRNRAGHKPQTPPDNRKGIAGEENLSRPVVVAHDAINAVGNFEDARP
jgi:hypothetical protein